MSEPFYEDIIMAGFGGQGLMFIGKLLAESAMIERRYVTWIPSYGGEMRGGTANCTVVISSERIGSPVIIHPQAAIVMNQPSFDAFGPRLREGGILVLNSSLIIPKEKNDITIIEVPANRIAMELGNERVANMVMLGAYVASKRVVRSDSILELLRHKLGKEKKNIYELNKKAFKIGEKIGVE